MAHNDIDKQPTVVDTNDVPNVAVSTDVPSNDVSAGVSPSGNDVAAQSGNAGVSTGVSPSGNAGVSPSGNGYIRVQQATLNKLAKRAAGITEAHSEIRRLRTSIASLITLIEQLQTAANVQQLQQLLDDNTAALQQIGASASTEFVRAKVDVKHSVDTSNVKHSVDKHVPDVDTSAAPATPDEPTVARTTANSADSSVPDVGAHNNHDLRSIDNNVPAVGSHNNHDLRLRRPVLAPRDERTRALATQMDQYVDKQAIAQAASTEFSRETPLSTSRVDYRALYQDVINAIEDDRGRAFMGNVTPDMVLVLCSSVEMGMTPKRAATLAGIRPSTWKKYEYDARLGQEPYASLMDLLAIAEARNEAKHVANWQSHSAINWQAAQSFLAKRYREEWGDRQVISVERASLQAMSDDELRQIAGELAPAELDADQILDVTPMEITDGTSSNE